MKYNMGDKVRVRKDLEIGRWYGNCCFVESMGKLRGEVVEIDKAFNSWDSSSRYYSIKEDEYKYSWAEEMLEPVITNFDKVKEEIKIEDLECGGICSVINRIRGEKNCIDRTCEECMKWLKQPHGEIKKEILDKEEKEYLSFVIKPFRDKIQCIVKLCGGNGKYFIDIRLSGDDNTSFPYFEKGTMYKGMEIDKKYTLEDLGL